MRNYLRTILILAFTFSLAAQGSVTIEKLNFKKGSKTGMLSVEFKGNLKDYPELSINGKSIQVLIPNAKVSKPIEKSISFSSTLKDTQLRAYQSTKSSSKIKVLLPFNIEKMKDKVSLTIRDNRIELTFPRKVMPLKVAPKFGSILKKTKKKSVKKDFLDEAYLNSLLKIDKKKTVKKEASVAVKKKSKDIMKDKVSMSMAAAKTPSKKDNFSLMEYGGKFVAFLGLVLLLFYGLVTLMKKGFIKKGKLGFLNNAEQVSVLNQTFIGPKKSLMLVKAHNQVFLVSNTEAGIHAISEIKDVAGLLKGEEKSLTGHNFDTNLGTADSDTLLESRIKVKDDISLSNQASSLSDYGNVKEKVKFSDQLKKKVKGLKPLQ